MLGAALFVAWWMIAQTPAPPVRDGVITGQVVDATTGRPVSAATVSIAGSAIPVRMGPSPPPQPPRILTGADGRFVFRDLPMGSFTITATKGGYSDGASGRRRPGGGTRPVVLADALRTMEVPVRVWKNGVITGTVTDEAGEPVVNLYVRALSRTLANGKRVFAPRGGSASTDDRGAYRFGNLPPGDYIVVASPPPVSAKIGVFDEVARTGRASGELGALLSSGAIAGLRMGDTLFGLGRGTAIPPPPVAGRLHVYPPTFHPAAHAAAQAATIALAAGEERAGVDLQLQPVPTARVSGTVTSPSGAPTSAMLRLVPAGLEGIDAAGLAPVCAADPAGAFVFPAVVPGQYALRAVERDGSTITWLDIPLTVAATDVDGVVAVLRPGLAARGRFEYEGAAQRPQGFINIAIGLDLVEGTPAAVLPPSVSANAGGATTSFTLQGLIPGRYVVRVSGSPAGWMFKSAMLNGVDVSATPFEMTRDVNDVVVTFTDRWSGIGGAVQGSGADGAIVAVFPVEMQAWTNYGSNPRRLRSVSTNAKGQFGLSSVPPGEYYVIAIPEEHAEDWRDPRMLEALARLAMQLSVVEGEHKMIDLRMQQVPR